MLNLDAGSRLWIYQSSRELTEDEVKWVAEELKAFTDQWDAHGKKLSADAEIRYKRFVLIAVDERMEMPSGCSIDKSVHVLKQAGIKLGIDFFDRTQVACRTGDQIRTFDFRQCRELLEGGELTRETVIFDNTIQKLQQLDSEWMKPLKESWLKKYLNTEKV